MLLIQRNSKMLILKHYRTLNEGHFSKIVTPIEL